MNRNTWRARWTWKCYIDNCQPTRHRDKCMVVCGDWLARCFDLKRWGLIHDSIVMTRLSNLEKTIRWTARCYASRCHRYKMYAGRKHVLLARLQSLAVVQAPEQYIHKVPRIRTFSFSWSSQTHSNSPQTKAGNGPFISRFMCVSLWCDYLEHVCRACIARNNIQFVSYQWRIFNLS